MAKVSLNINGRKYSLGCDEGEEERLMRLGQQLDERVKILANQFGQIGDLRLLVMAGITMTDQLEELSEGVEGRAEAMASEIRQESAAAVTAAAQNERRATDSLVDAARRIEKLADRLSSG